jgi:hypothetical protein
MKRANATMLCMVLLIGCRALPPAVAPDAGQPVQRMECSELYFGLARPEGTAVSEQEWQAFLDETITPRFPDGLTILDGVGQWRGADGKISHERSKILVILHPIDQELTRKLDEIRIAYKQKFNQESVIRQSGKVWVSF